MSKKKNTHSTGTPATTLLDRESVPYTVHSYTHDPAVANYGLEAAEAIGVPPARVFKTLLVSTGEPGPAALVVGIIPVNRSLDLKAMAAALGLKKVEMADPAVAERRTGYVVGGISPLAQRNHSRTMLDASALAHRDHLRLRRAPRAGRRTGPGGPAAADRGGGRAHRRH